MASLEDMIEILGARQACLAREMTKIHEEWLRGTLTEIADAIRVLPQIRGEITLVVAPGPSMAVREQPACPASIEQHLAEELLRTGASPKDALKAIARQRGLSRREAYRQLHIKKEP